MHRPPVDSVGYSPVHSSSTPSTCAASSITNNDRDSERPASEDVDEAFISDPFDNTNEARLSIVIFAICIHGGRFLIICFTFFTRLPAVWNLVAITRIFLLRWKSIIHAIYAAVVVEMPSCLAFKMTLNRLSLKSLTRVRW